MAKIHSITKPVRSLRPKFEIITIAAFEGYLVVVNNITGVSYIVVPKNAAEMSRMIDYTSEEWESNLPLMEGYKE